MCKKDAKRKGIEDNTLPAGAPPSTPSPKKPKADPEDGPPLGFFPPVKPEEIKEEPQPVKEEPAAAEAKPE